VTHRIAAGVDLLTTVSPHELAAEANRNLLQTYVGRREHGGGARHRIYTPGGMVDRVRKLRRSASEVPIELHALRRHAYMGKTGSQSSSMLKVT
jgi:hypothetical protein